MKKVLFFMFAAFATNLHAAEFKNVFKTCTSITLDKASISAICVAENGGKYQTALRLRGINSQDGVLTVDANTATLSKFHTTCTETSVDSRGILAGRCKTNDGDKVWSMLDLTKLIANYNGSIVYPVAKRTFEE
jgi:hypothetical protein